ncbi:MAG: monooxygenase, partial [Flavobacteriales bacterium]|nr:monooxygenase [Flavobacteriales bacterium]
VFDKSLRGKKFLEGCTPGYYNNEGQVNTKPQNGTYGGGPFEFFALMKKWRAKGNLPGLELS